MRKPSVSLIILPLLVCSGCVSFPPKQFSASPGQQFYCDVTLVAVGDDDIIVRRRVGHTAPITIPADSKPHSIGSLEAIRVLKVHGDHAEVEVSSLRRCGPIVFPP